MNSLISRFIKSLLSLILVLCIITSLSVTTIFAAQNQTANTLPSDISESDWFYENVLYVYENGIMKGIKEGIFAPHATMSRAMSVTILYRMAGEPDITSATHSFNDVKAGKWYSDAIVWGYNSQIIEGRSDTEFGPEDDITRGEFATMLWRYAEHSELALPAKRNGHVADEVHIPFFARTAAKVMYQAEVINGRPGYMFDAFELISRAEAAAIIERFSHNSVPKDSIVEPDVPEYDPELYLDIVFIGNSFTYTGNFPGHFHAIADDKLVKIYNYAKALYSLENHYNWFTGESKKDELNTVIENADIIILQEFGGYYPDTYYAEKLMDLFGRDKEYYAILPFFGPSPEVDDINAEYQANKELYLSEHDIKLVYLSNVYDFDSKLGFKEEDFLIVNDYHPNDIMGYSMALAMYCTIFDEKAADQNDGELSLHMIPGDTESEKDVFMKKLRDTVQMILDYQNNLALPE